MAESRFVYVTYIRTSPEKLWQALTDPAFIRQYWFGMTVDCAWTKGALKEPVPKIARQRLFLRASTRAASAAAAAVRRKVSSVPSSTASGWPVAHDKST